MIQSYITKNDCYKQNRPLTPKGLMLHSVGCSQPKASVFVSSWNRSGVQVAVHAVIDANTGEVYQCLPWVMRGWHAGGQANNTHIGVEMCEPDCIKYTHGATFTVSDLAKAQKQAKTTYTSAVKLFSELCRMFNLKSSDIISHSEGNKRGIASNHVDPEHLWRQLNLPYTMDSFRHDVQAVLDSHKLPENTVQNVQPVQPMNEKTIANKIWSHLKACGYSDTGAAGIMGNLHAESGLSPINLQNTYNKKFNLTDEQYTQAVDNGTYTNFVDDKAGYGLAQWTFKTRKAALLKYAKQQKLSIGSLELQLAYLASELLGYKSLDMKLRQNISLYDATKLFLTQFEKPADQSEKVVQKRLTFASMYYNMYVGEHMFRVRASWEDKASQVGAFKNKANAINLAIKHHLNVYDENGMLVFKS